MPSLAQPENTAATTDIRRELQGLSSGCGFHVLEQSLTSLKGADRVRWLNGMVTNNIRDLTPGNGVYAFVLTPQGQIRGDLYAFNRGESLVIETERAQTETLLPLLRRYIIMDKVEVEDLSGAVGVVGLVGPKSAATLAAIGLNAGELKPLQISELSWSGNAITVVRKDHPVVDSFELWAPSEIVASLTEALRERGAIEVSVQTLEVLRIASGTPKIGQDIREKTLPQETGQDRALNFNKGCFIGQEIVERIRARGAVHRTLAGFEVEGPSPVPGEKIQSEGKDAGEITSVAIVSANDSEKVIALGVLRKEYLGGEKELMAGDARLRIASLPFAGVFGS
ncbi:MAG TPA: folate-binding protein [Terriglobales bacterium]